MNYKDLKITRYLLVFMIGYFTAASCSQQVQRSTKDSEWQKTKELVQKGPTEFCRTVLFAKWHDIVASIQGHEDEFVAELKKGVDLSIEWNFTSGQSVTLLLYAMHRGSTTLEGALRAAGAGDVWAFTKALIQKNGRSIGEVLVSKKQLAYLMPALVGHEDEFVDELVKADVDLLAEWPSGKGKKTLFESAALLSTKPNSLLSALRKRGGEGWLAIKSAIEKHGSRFFEHTPEWYSYVFGQRLVGHELDFVNALQSAGVNLSGEWPVDDGTQTLFQFAGDHNDDLKKVLRELGADGWKDLKTDIQTMREHFCERRLVDDYDHLIACIEGHPEEFVAELTHAGIDLSQTWMSENKSHTLFTFAMRKPSSILVKALIEGGASLQALPDSADGETPLHRAIAIAKEDEFEEDMIECIKLFVQGGASLTAENSEGKTPLMVSDDSRVIKLLIEGGAGLNYRSKKDGRTFMHHVQSEGILYPDGEDFYAYLQTQGADFNGADIHGDTPLHVLVQKGRFPEESLEDMIRMGANVNGKNTKGETPIVLAYQRGAGKAVALLLKHGANVQDVPWNVYDIAVLADEAPALETLIEWHPSVRNDLGRMLHLSVQAGCLRTQNVLLKHGADPNFEHDGMPPLARAIQAKECSLESIKNLCKFGANLEYAKAGRSLVEKPLIMALKSNVGAVRTLLELGADPNAKDWEGRSALLHGIPARGVDSLESLLAKGADPNVPYNRVTPLLALLKQLGTQMFWGRHYYVELLLKHGASMHAKDQEGNSPLSEAFLVKSTKGIPDFLIKNCFWSYMPSEQELINARARIYAAAQGMTRCGLPAYIQMWVLLADKSTERDAIFLLLGCLQKGNMYPNKLLVGVKDATALYLENKLKPHLDDARERLVALGNQVAVKDFDELLPRVRELIVQGITNRFLTPKSAEEWKANQLALMFARQEDRRKKMKTVL